MTLQYCEDKFNLFYGNGLPVLSHNYITAMKLSNPNIHIHPKMLSPLILRLLHKRQIQFMSCKQRFTYLRCLTALSYCTSFISVSFISCSNLVINSTNLASASRNFGASVICISEALPSLDFPLDSQHHQNQIVLEWFCGE